MYQAVIVDDEPEILEYLLNTLSAEFSNNHISVAFDSFNFGKQLLNMVNNHYHYDIIFLDIEMPDINGIELCRQLKTISPECLVIFISNKDELVFQSFEVQPFRFIRKSHFHKELPSLVNDIITQLARLHRKTIHITEPLSHDIYAFDVENLLYIEAQGKYCKFVTKSDQATLKCKLSYIEDLLSSYNFIKPHRSYLINLEHVITIGKNMVVLSNKNEIPVSRNKIDEVKRCFLEYLC